MATSAHRRAVDEPRTAARRHGDPAWRLLGIEGDPGLTQADALAKLAPCLGEWAPAEVIGKASRAREVPLPKVALQATREYFAAREIDFDSAPPETPLLGSLRAGPVDLNRSR